MLLHKTKRIAFTEKYTRNIEHAFSNALNDFGVEERYIPYLIIPKETGERGPEPSPTETASINVSKLQQWLLNLGANPNGLVSSKTGKPDGKFGPKTKSALLTIARDQGFDKVLTIPSGEKKPYASKIKISPSKLARTLEAKASIVKDKIYTATGPEKTTTGLPSVESGTIGELIDKVRKNYTNAQDFKDRILFLEKEGKLSNKAITAYKQWFLTTSNLQRLLGNRLKSNKIFTEVDRVARAEGTTGDELIYTISQIPVVNITKYTGSGARLGPLPPSQIPVKIETGFGDLGSPIVFILLAGAAVAGIGLWKGDLILEEVRLMKENEIAQIKLETILRALEKGTIRAEDIPAIIKGEELEEEESRINIFPFLAGSAILFSIGTVFYITHKKKSK